jgi:folate-dependent phosphoribosylglycinamide formyltransferase PurN
MKSIVEAIASNNLLEAHEQITISLSQKACCLMEEKKKQVAAESFPHKVEKEKPENDQDEKKETKAEKRKRVKKLLTEKD